MPALQTETLFISAGHSDTQPGAAAHGMTEAGIVLEFRDLLADYLRSKVVFAKDGERGQNLPLRNAAHMAAKHDIAVEFHCNAGPPGATGVETLSRPEHYPLGRELCAAVSHSMGITSRGAKPENSGQHSRLAFVSDGGGILLELFFLSNKLELSKYIANRRRVVEAVGNVLVRAVTSDYS